MLIQFPILRNWNNWKWTSNIFCRLLISIPEYLSGISGWFQFQRLSILKPPYEVLLNVSSFEGEFNSKTRFDEVQFCCFYCFFDNFSLFETKVAVGNTILKIFLFFLSFFFSLFFFFGLVLFSLRILRNSFVIFFCWTLSNSGE